MAGTKDVSRNELSDPLSVSEEEKADFAHLIVSRLEIMGWNVSNLVSCMDKR